MASDDPGKDPTDPTNPTTRLDDDATPESQQWSFFDPDAPFGSSGLLAAVIGTAVLFFAWWGILHVANCGLDAGGGPPPLPKPSTFGRNNLMYLIAGLGIVPLPLIAVWRLDKTSGRSNLALQGAVVCAFLISYLGVKHFVVGASYWVDAC